MAQEPSISHVVASLYDFSDAAGREAVSSFRKNSTSDVICHFNDHNCFTVHASLRDDDLLACLVNSIRDFISAEKNQDPDVFEDRKITRISGTHPSSLALAALPSTRMQTIKLNGEVPLIEHENVIRKWSPNTESRGLGPTLGLQLLGAVGNLCGCRIEHANNSADLLLKADREQDIEKAISKLERLNKMMIDEICFPRIYSFYILEGETSVDMQLVAFRDLNDKRPATTPLRKDLPVRSLRDICVLVLVKGSNIFQITTKPAASSQEYRLWNDHVYDYNQAQGLIAGNIPKEPKTPIDKWVSEVTDTDAQVDAFRPESSAEVQQLAGMGIVYKEPLSPTKKPITKRARTVRGHPDAFTETFTEPRYGLDNKEATIPENVARFGSHQTTGITYKGKESESLRQPPSIEPPYMPPRAMPSRSLSKAPSGMPEQLMPSSASWNVVAPGGKSGSLVDMSVPSEGFVKDEAMLVVSNLQDTKKAKPRDFKHTMNQRKAAGQPLLGGDTALVKSFEEIITHLLVSALPRTGRVIVAVNIGRLLINQQYGSSEFKNRSFKTSEFSLVLPKGRTTGFEPIFTNMLTARSVEAESILNLLLPQGRRLFQQRPISRKVTYVFSCKAKGDDQVIFEYDENGGFKMRGSEILMGTLDWHFPKRVWDARLRLSSERFLTADYQRHVKGIVDNIKIGVSGDGQSVELWTKTVDDNLSIESITLRRETLHPITVYPDLILHLTEYQDLQVRQPPDSKSIYSGSIQASNVMVKANRLWWGAEISSVKASTILNENTTLELGEKATWSPSIIANGVVGDLFAAAKEIVTRIDHVGFFNRGEGSSNSKTTERRSESIQDTSARLGSVDIGFW